MLNLSISGNVELLEANIPRHEIFQRNRKSHGKVTREFHARFLGGEYQRPGGDIFGKCLTLTTGSELNIVQHSGV